MKKKGAKKNSGVLLCRSTRRNSPIRPPRRCSVKRDDHGVHLRGEKFGRRARIFLVEGVGRRPVGPRISGKIFEERFLARSSRASEKGARSGGPAAKICFFFSFFGPRVDGEPDG